MENIDCLSSPHSFWLSFIRQVLHLRHAGCSKPWTSEIRIFNIWYSERWTQTKERVSMQTTLIINLWAWDFYGKSKSSSMQKQQKNLHLKNCRGLCQPPFSCKMVNFGVIFKTNVIVLMEAVAKLFESSFDTSRWIIVNKMITHFRNFLFRSQFKLHRRLFENLLERSRDDGRLR